MRVLSNLNTLEGKIGLPTPPGKPQTFSKQFTANIDSSIICDGESDALPHRRSQRRFPGPAGLLPLMKPTELETGGINISDVNNVFVNKPCRREELNISNSQASSDECSQALPGSQMQGTLHRDVLRDFGAELQAGAAIVLRQVSVISPSSRTHYLNITSANIVAIYPSQGCTGQVILPGSLLQSSASGQTAQQTLKTYIHTADVELIEEGNKRMENTLVSMRQRMGEGTLPQAPFTPGSVRGNQQPPNTMTECRVQRLPPVQHNMSQGTPLTPQYQFVRNSQNTVAQPAHSSSSIQIKTPNSKVLANCKAGIADPSPSTSAFVPKVWNNRDNEVSGCLVKSCQSSGFSPIREMEIACPNTLKVSSGASDLQGESSTGQLSFNQQSADVSESVWFDDLNDDILSQLSDDF
ncbi:hypothetical protein C0Q70_15128 [Pomacea canaliculata]|uniref:Homologous recombination OB-fold protein OB-fold domain-containing protein n=1 Tax=Pomacea canaliculata TaxID=400727 RepID=A0A2T7NU14_POMCA|nr:hypothetical protein C0Q70_15128 [Pomacea canaliculata]